ncbi:MAG TPA: hypothetical protein VFE60_24790 [Roseiarcus sp.]|nr:hypothetical protein [Roseiarcus sp.]
MNCGPGIGTRGCKSASVAGRRSTIVAGTPGNYRRRLEAKAAEAERAREATRRAIDLAHALIG